MRNLSQRHAMWHAAHWLSYILAGAVALSSFFSAWLGELACIYCPAPVLKFSAAAVHAHLITVQVDICGPSCRPLHLEMPSLCLYGQRS